MILSIHVQNPNLEPFTGIAPVLDLLYYVLHKVYGISVLNKSIGIIFLTAQLVVSILTIMYF